MLEYWDQPESIRLLYDDRNGRRIGVTHTADFLVLRREGATWEECKPEDKLHTLAKQSPNRYVHLNDGTWTCPPGEEYATRLGLSYRLRSSKGIDWMLQRNIMFLTDYLREDTPRVNPEVAGRVSMVVQDRPGLTLNELTTCMEGVSRDVIHIMIATGAIHVDLRAAPLAQPEEVLLFRDFETATAYQIVGDRTYPATHVSPSNLLALSGTNLLWDERAHTIINAGTSKVVLQTMDGVLIKLARQGFEDLLKAGEITARTPENAGDGSDLRELLAGTSQKEHVEANQRYLII